MENNTTSLIFRINLLINFIKNNLLQHYLASDFRMYIYGTGFLWKMSSTFIDGIFEYYLIKMYKKILNILCKRIVSHI